jgi:hypothetical protein
MPIDRATAPAAARSGVLISTPHDGGPSVIQDTVSCIHCGFTWIWGETRIAGIPGTGVRRGWCTKHMGILCGRPVCVARGCVHRERLLDNMEAGKPLDYQPIIASVPAGVPRAA